MGRKTRKLVVKEDITTLKKYLFKCTSSRQKKRVHALMYFKNESLPNQDLLCEELNIGIRTLQKWKKMYIEEGIKGFLKEQTRVKPSKLISSELHKALEARFNSNKNPFLGYWDVQNWIRVEFDVELKYSHLRQYLIKHFGSKIKFIRRSRSHKIERMGNCY